MKGLMREKIANIEELFTKIMAATGINDLGMLVENFIKGEEKNFALFKFVNEINAENELFETQILEMQSEIDRNLAEGGQGSKKRQEIKDMESKLNRAREEIVEMEKSQEKDTEKISRIKACIGKISQVIDCKVEENQELVGHQGITESNMFIYMGMVEQRINEILQAYAYIKAKNSQPLYDAVESAAVGSHGRYGLQGMGQAAAEEAERKRLEKIQQMQEQIMMPGIFQHAGKMAGVGTIEPPSFDQQFEDDDDEDAEFGRNRKQVKAGTKKHEKSPGPLDFGKDVGESDEDDDDGSDDADMFAVPMDSAAFMAQIVKQQQDLLK